MQRRERSFLSLNDKGFHRVVYQDWGDPAAPRAVVCVHGLTRNGRDFDRLADALSAEAHVACPDVVGRGKSDWLPDPMAYGVPQYLRDMTVLIARMGLETVDWVGTSMGGLIGMTLAAQPGNPVRRLVLNDIGPFLPEAAIKAVQDSTRDPDTYESLEALEQRLREVHAGFGTLPDVAWRHMAEHSARALDDGRIARAFDPDILKPARGQPVTDQMLWPIWDKITCPVLVLRGQKSELLTRETAEEMAERGPKAKVVEFPACGHAPSLMIDDQIAVIRDWLAETDA